jgi:hypothetical protein
MANIYDLSDTWNAGATVFTAIKMNVTDTASAAGSLLMDLQVGGVTQLGVAKAKSRIFGTQSDNGGVSISTTATSTVFTEFVGNSIFFYNTGNLVCSINRSGFKGFDTTSDGYISWSNSTTSSGNPGDTILRRDAANTLAQRNGVNAQAFNLYNTYTDASNYERGFMRFVSNVLEIGPEATGTGSLRDLRLGNVNARITINNGSLITFQASAGASSQLAIRNTNKVGLNQGGLLGWSNSASSADPSVMTALFNYVANGVIGVRGSSATDGGSLEFLEQTAPAAPAADRVRIYAEDDGAGKTRLMAVFGSGAAQQIAIEP